MLNGSQERVADLYAEHLIDRGARGNVLLGARGEHAFGSYLARLGYKKAPLLVMKHQIDEIKERITDLSFDLELSGLKYDIKTTDNNENRYLNLGRSKPRDDVIYVQVWAHNGWLKPVRWWRTSRGGLERSKSGKGWYVPKRFLGSMQTLPRPNSCRAAP